MPAPENRFKARLKAGDRLIGLWSCLADHYASDILGTAGFDWIVVDGEHAPNDIRSIRDQVMALAPYETEAVVRIPAGETWMVKQVLDTGAQTVLVPMVESKEQAEDLVRACQYPPHGLRGVGAAPARGGKSDRRVVPARHR